MSLWPCAFSPTYVKDKINGWSNVTVAYPGGFIVLHVNPLSKVMNSLAIVTSMHYLMTSC